jgi:hypothetical protein
MGRWKWTVRTMIARKVVLIMLIEWRCVSDSRGALETLENVSCCRTNCMTVVSLH